MAIKIPHNKFAAALSTVSMPMPKTVKILTAQHIGTPNAPLCSVGGRVLRGQKIADTDVFVSAPVHSSASGTVTAIENGAIFIACDEAAEDFPTSVPIITDKPSLLSAVRESGMVGLGGAGFPTHVKLAADGIDTLIINAAECESYITSDHREMLDHPQQIKRGIETILKYIGIPKAIIGIENNKPDAIKLLSEIFDGTNVKVRVLPSAYPQGAEKVLIRSLLGRIVPAGKLPADVGVIVLNVSTVSNLGKFFESGVPLISRVITVAGDCTPANVEVPIGTSVDDILAFSGQSGDISKIILGGPMMGKSVESTDIFTTKTVNAVLSFADDKAVLPTATNCIRCGKCVSACPVNLMPLFLERAFDRKDVSELKSRSVQLCINCGCCSYVCPAKRDLAGKIQAAKVMEKGAG